LQTKFARSFERFGDRVRLQRVQACGEPRIRRKLGVGPGSVLEWHEDGERVVVCRAGQHTSADIHHALFSKGRPAARTAEAEANYWQGFTAKQALLGVVPVANRRGVGYGRTVSGGGVTVMVEVGTDVDRRRLFNDWVLTHELIHTGMPYIRGRGTWLMEGAATYVEPIIRARAGWKTEEEVWREWVDNMPQGVEAFSTGLANASGRQNYWAGATFMLLADIAIRRASDGAKGLDDCLGGVLWTGLDGGQRASVADYAAACDRAAGTTAMSTLVDRHFTKAEPVDLAALWKELGISVVGGRIVLDDSAPSAQWRRMIVPGNHPPKRVKLPWES